MTINDFIDKWAPQGLKGARLEMVGDIFTILREQQEPENIAQTVAINVLSSVKDSQLQFGTDNKGSGFVTFKKKDAPENTGFGVYYSTGVGLQNADWHCLLQIIATKAIQE